MQCPRCKKEIQDNSLKCDNCNAKIGSLCYNCNSYNLITALECSYCHAKLLKICSECGAANLPNAPRCRKCNIEFVSQEHEEAFSVPIHFESMKSQQKVKERLVNALKDNKSKIISLTGDSGVGKNLILRSAVSEIDSNNYIWMYGACSQVTQMSPLGYFQDVLLSFFNINNFCPDTLQLKKNSIKFFKQDFPTLTNNDVIDLLNILYPEKFDRYENIYLNKSKTFALIKKIFFTIIEKINLVFIIDNYDFIDGMSHDLIQELLKEEAFINKVKFVVLSTSSHLARGIFTSPLLDDDNYLDLLIAPFTPMQVGLFLKQYKDIKLGSDFVNLAVKVSGGNPSFIEQMVYLYQEAKQHGLKHVDYTSLESIIIQRLNVIKNNDLKSYRFLIALAILGVKFYPAILENFDNDISNNFEQKIEKLINLGFISQINNLSFEFKTTDIWNIILANVKIDECFDEILNSLMDLLSRYKQTSPVLLAYISQKLNNTDQAFELWTMLMKQASYIGDIGLYIVVQKQSLKLIENKSSDFYQHVKKNIYTRVGKLLEPIDHEASFDYLQKAILLLEDDENTVHIELLGYLASCSMKSGNYCGVIECIESVLNKLSNESTFEKVLIKTRLIKPLLRLGNYGQLINIVETELLKDLEKVLIKGRNTAMINIADLFEIWIDIYLDYAEALSFQGDNKAFDIIQVIEGILEKNKVSDSSKFCKVNLVLALAYTIKGDFKLSNKILDDILKEYTLDSMNSFIVSRWNLIDILNKFFLGDYATLHSELFNVAAYANNVNDSFTKNLLKTLLAKILKENNQTKKALEILEEQVAYFAKEKVATGVLISWYLIAQIKLITSGSQFALDIATKALDIAQGPNINNYYFIAMFNKLIGEIYLAKQDFESSKVYLEKAIIIAKQFDLNFVLLQTYLQCAKLYQELALPKTSSRTNYIKLALKMFQNAKNISIVQDHSSLQKKIKEELNILTSFCKLNGIILKKENK